MKIPPAHILEKMSQEDRRRFFPGAAGHTPAECAQFALAKSEKELQGQLEGLLRRNRIIPVRQRMDVRSNIAIGLPDIMFSCKGRACFWEVKMPGQNPTDEQRKMITELVLDPNRAHVRVIRSYIEALADLRTLLSLPEPTTPASTKGPEVPAA